MDPVCNTLDVLFWLNLKTPNIRMSFSSILFWVNYFKSSTFSDGVLMWNNLQDVLQKMDKILTEDQFKHLDWRQPCKKLQNWVGKKLSLKKCTINKTCSFTSILSLILVLERKNVNFATFSFASGIDILFSMWNYFKSTGYSILKSLIGPSHYY